jgi:site-specific recombinase XerD
MITGLEGQLIDLVQQLTTAGEVVCGKLVKERLRKKGPVALSFKAFALQRLDGEPLLRKNYRRHVACALNAVDEFSPGVKPSEITLTWVEQFHDHLLRSGMKPGSTRNYHKQVRKYYRAAALHGLADLPSPYDFFKVPATRGRRVALTVDELKAISRLELSTQRMTHVRDVFLFACYTGLAFVDLHQLMPGHIINHDGQLLISKRRSKLADDEPDTLIPLLPPAVAIIERYQGGVRCLPVYSNQRYNEYLKQLATLAGIDKPLTSHIARHTFATLGLEAGVPLESVSKMLGHNSIKTTQIYAQVLKSKLQHDIKAFGVMIDDI